MKADLGESTTHWPTIRQTWFIPIGLTTPYQMLLWCLEFWFYYWSGLSAVFLNQFSLTQKGYNTVLNCYTLRQNFNQYRWHMSTPPMQLKPVRVKGYTHNLGCQKLPRTLHGGEGVSETPFWSRSTSLKAVVSPSPRKYWILYSVS